MKKLLLFAFFIGLCSLSLFGQRDEVRKVPKEVKSAFKTKFSKAGRPIWYSLEENMFEAEFEMNEKLMFAVYDEMGKWKETRTVIKHTALPAPIKETIKSSLSDHTIKKAMRIDRPKGDKSYKLLMIKGEERFDVLFVPDGKMTSKTLSVEEMEEEEMEEGEEE